MQWISNLRRWRCQDQAGSIIFEVIVIYDDGPSGLEARGLASRGPLWQRPKQYHRFLDERAHVSMDARRWPERRFESFSDVNEPGRHGAGIVAMYELVKGVEVALAISTRLTVFGHNGLGLDRNADGRGRGLLNAFRRYGQCEAGGGRAEHEVNVPFASGNDDLSLDVIDKMPCGCMFRDLRTHRQEIDEYELTQNPSMNA